MKNTGKLKQFFLSGIFSSGMSTYSALINTLTQQDSIKIIYGETYDKYGLTLESLKYYLVLHILTELLKDEGKEITTHLLIGDTASLRNIKTKAKQEEIKKVMETNNILIQNFIRSHKLSVTPVLMSDLFSEDTFVSNLREITNAYNDSPEFREKFKSTVLANRLKEEQKKDFLYTREEVALIMNYNIKIGPPREVTYDQIANHALQSNGSPPLLGIYLKPTYPLGKGFDYFINNPQIEQFGLTPYKAGSNQLQENRILFGKMKRSKLLDLLERSFRPMSLELPDPVLDLYIITDLIRRVSIGDYNFTDYSQLKITTEEVMSAVDKFLPDIYE